MNAALAFFQTLGPARLGAMGVVAAALAGFFAFVILQFNTATMLPLYSSLSLDDSIAITKELDTAQIKYQMKSDGTAIYVASEDVLKTRMKLAESGLPSGGAVGYEVFDRQSALGTTSFVQNINQLRALEGELARTIRTIDRIQSARVHLVLPERQLFRQDQQEPTASIVIKTRGQLEAPQIRAIQHLTASAVPGLKPSRVAIVDEFGRLLASGSGDDGANPDSSTLQDKNLAFESRLRTQIEQIVEHVVGPGKAKVNVTADLDYSRVTQTADTFDPNGQVVRSTQTKQENSQTSADNNQVSASAQVPNGSTAQIGGNKDASANTEEVVNYEISRTTRTEVQEAGRVKRLSVAVLVDGVSTTDAQGKVTYAPRPQPEIDQITQLVKTAMGFDDKRGDQISVVNLQFAGVPADGTVATNPGLFDFTKDDIIKLVQWGVMGLISLLVLLFVARPLVNRVLGRDELLIIEDGSGQVASRTVNPDGSTTVVIQSPDGAAATTITLDPEGNTIAQSTAPVAPNANGEPLQPDRIHEARLQGEVQMDQVRRVGELVEQNPNEAAIVVRLWLGEGK